MDLDAPSPSTLLSSSEFRERFLKEWHRSIARFLKVERRQEYAEPNDPSYQAFARGNFAEAHRLVAERIREQESFYRPARAKGVDLVRVRIVDDPLSSYLRDYELPSYVVSAQLGERIVVTRAGEVKQVLDRFRVPDFLLFDARCVLVNNYNEAGAPDGALLVDEPALVDEYRSVAERLVASAVELETFLADEGITVPPPN